MVFINGHIYNIRGKSYEFIDKSYLNVGYIGLYIPYNRPHGHEAPDILQYPACTWRIIPFSPYFVAILVSGESDNVWYN